MRGEVFHFTASRTRGHEQAGTRYAVALQNDAMWAASTLIVAPTSTSARDNDYHPEAVVRDQRTRLMIDQIQAVDRSRLGESVGYLTFDELSHVNEALRLVLDL